MAGTFEASSDAAAARRGRSRRGLGLAVGLGLCAVLAVGSVAIATRSYRYTWVTGGTVGLRQIVGRCRSPVATAGSTDRGQIHLQAVEIGTGHVRDGWFFPGGYCAAQSRHRLIQSAWLLGAGVVVLGLVIWRRRRRRRLV